VIRERWFGATGRKVSEIALEGTVDLEGALVLDDVSDVAAINTAHEAGTPVVVRASTAEEVHAALSLGAVSCALVRDDSLLSLNLGEMTYG
jgi:imidazolonepropionase-like amidohydrolase